MLAEQDKIEAIEAKDVHPSTSTGIFDEPATSAELTIIDKPDIPQFKKGDYNFCARNEFEIKFVIQITKINTGRNKSRLEVNFFRKHP